MPDTEGRYEILLDGEWSLEDLYIFPRTFEQVYFLLHSFSITLDEVELERVRHAFNVFPWQGGYSAVNFYNQLKYITPKKNRPQIISIEYSSPGALELGLIVAVAVSVGQLVKTVARSIREMNETYGDIMKGMQDRKLMRLKVKNAELRLEQEQLRFVEEAAETMARLLGFNTVSQLHERTGHPYRTLKILMSLYRRIRTLADYQIHRKVKFSTDESSQIATREPPTSTL